MILDTLTLGAIVIGLTEALKRGFGIPHKWIPLLAVALAICIGGSAAFWGLTGMDFFDAIVVGLMSVGLYSGVKNTIKK